MVCDGADEVAFAALSFMMEETYTIGYVALTNVHEGWFTALETTPWFQPTTGLENGWFATWPLLHHVFGTDLNVEHTMNYAR